MNEISPGLWHWKAMHPKIGIEVSSYYVADGGTLIDPMLPAEGIDSVRRIGEPQRILLTTRHHYRQSDAFREESACPVLCHEAGLHEFEGGPPVQGFSFGDDVANGILALEVGVLTPEETAFHIDSGPRALSFGDAIVSLPDEGLQFVPDKYMGDDPEAEKEHLRAGVRRLLEFDFDNLMFAHGAPLIGGAKAALAEFVQA